MLHDRSRLDPDPARELGRLEPDRPPGTRTLLNLCGLLLPFVILISLIRVVESKPGRQAIDADARPIGQPFRMLQSDNQVSQTAEDDDDQSAA